MIEVNLFGGFTHLTKPDGIYSMTDNRIPKGWKWVRDQVDFDGITIFTDDCMCNTKLVKTVKSKYKIGMIIEPPQINSNVYNNLDDIIDNFDFIITYNKYLVDKYPDKIQYYPYGGCWVLEENIGIYEKSKIVNILYSNKLHTDGHKLRHLIANEKIPEIDRYGLGTRKPFEFKEEVLAPYMFTIVVENSNIEGYFSEKLLDAMAVGTIPIYWGCPNIGDYFDESSIITFNNMKDLDEILPTLNKDLYDSMLPGVENNITKLKEYYCQEDWIKNNIFCNLDINESLKLYDYDTNDIRTKVYGLTQQKYLDEFSRNGGDDGHLYEVTLPENAVIFDLGSYDGEWSRVMYNKHNDALIHSFDPIPPDCCMLHAFKDNHFAIGNENKEFTIHLNDNASSEFGDGESMICKMVKFDDYISSNNIEHIDLMKLNIEGGEFDLLEHIIDSGQQEIIGEYLIQFHYLGENAVERRQKIVDQLKMTHRCVFEYPFVWECYKKIKD